MRKIIKCEEEKTEMKKTHRDLPPLVNVFTPVTAKRVTKLNSRQEKKEKREKGMRTKEQ